MKTGKHLNKGAIQKLVVKTGNGRGRQHRFVNSPGNRQGSRVQGNTETQNREERSELHAYSVTRLRKGHRENSGLNKELNNQ